MKKIIVPVDFSTHSEYALKAAASLAKKNDATIYALHMLDFHETTFSESANFQHEKIAFFLKMAEKNFEKFLQKEYLKDVEIIPILKNFKVFKEVNTIAEEVGADFIIMGSHGASGLKEFFVGSNTEKVVRYATIPVLVIKEELVDFDFTDVVFATDFSTESIPSFKKALQTFDFFDARTHLVYVNLPNESFKTTAEMHEMAHDFLLEAEGNISRMDSINYVCDRTVNQGIANFSNTIGADLIAVTTHGRKGLSLFFSGSVSEDMANHSTLPVITFKI